MTNQASSPDPIPAAVLLEFCVDVLQAYGVSDAHARTAADALVATDCWGVFTHGTKLLPGYVKRVRAGGIRTDAEPAIAREGPAWAVIDSRSTLGQVSSVAAMRAAIAKARSAGVGYAGVFNGNHFGAAGYYAWLAAREGMIGMAMANDIPSVAAPGSRTAVTGSNPIAYAIPAGAHDPILLDVATSTVSGGKVYAARTRGEPIPPGWLIGPDGLPTTDGSLYPQKAVLTPMAGHKGYGIALLVESLAGVLSGAAVTWKIGSWIFDDPSLPTNHGAAFLAFDVKAIMPEREFLERVDALIAEIRATPAAPGASRVLLPGEREWELRKRYLAEGIPLPAEVREILRALAAEAGVKRRRI
ncbi:MAG TPA: malate dehydrogenase [Planctomycetes bacterium]|nr:malate dehydrogenase [Planctomycetota bacterium]